MIAWGVAAAGLVIYALSLWFHSRTVKDLIDAFAQDSNAAREERKRMLAAVLARNPGEFAVYTREPRPRKEKPYVEPDENVPVGL